MSARVARGACPGGNKVRFRNRNAARAAADTWRQVAKRSGAPDRQYRAYRCPECNGWHLTTQAASHPSQ